MLDWTEFVARLVVIGPAAGVAVGAGGAFLMSKADRRFSISREYQALYGIGLVLASFFAGDRLGSLAVERALQQRAICGKVEHKTRRAFVLDFKCRFSDR